MFRFLGTIVILVFLASGAQARQHHRTYAVDPGCNVIFPCEGVAASPRGERVVKAMGGFGVARKIYTPPAAHTQLGRISDAQIVEHPSGCPSRLFCGCGAAVRVFGAPVRDLWLASNWFRFPRAAPAPGMVAVSRHHVFVLEAELGSGLWQVFDANSGGGATRIHARSLAGYTIVNPHGAG